MFIGYQKNKVVMIGSTREELENAKCIKFTKIEETDKTYFLHNGEYVYEVSFEQQVEDMSNARAQLYAQRVDPLMAEYNRKKTFNLFEEGEEEALLKEVETIVSEIKYNHPYPEQNLTEVSEDVIVDSGESDEISG